MQWTMVVETTHNDRGWVHPIHRNREVYNVNLPGNIKLCKTAEKRIREDFTTVQYNWDLMKHERVNKYVGRHQRILALARSDTPEVETIRRWCR